MTGDAHSFARPLTARVTHLDLDLTVDFEARRIRGRVALDLSLAPGAAEVVLDTRGLVIAGVTDAGGAALAFSLGEVDALLGRALTVALPAGTSRVVVAYETGPDASALDWLEPEQTAGGGHPFLFTHGHAIETRSWIPTQDSPGVRQTYDARVTVPASLVALMSADHLPPAPGDGATRTFDFRMRLPAPPHLIALAVGDSAFRAVGPRTGVFAEPSVVERAAREFDDLERMMDAAEALGGPYRWGRFDVLLMPPSFPYGGMENPRLTFASSSLLAGDWSLTTVVAHELAHAWAGNLVTNATWDDFWINEGITVYVELRMNEALWGEERAGMLRTYGFRELSHEVERQGSASPDTRLRYDMTGRDPVVGVTVIPYLKGSALLEALERAASRPRFDAWLRGLFDRHAFTSITTEALLEDLAAHLFGVAAWRDAPFDLARWVDAPGLPGDATPPPSPALDRIAEAARAFLAGADATSLGGEAWGAHAWRHFLGVLLDAPQPSGARLEELDDVFGLSSSENAEVLFAWLRVAARAHHAPALPALERFLMTHGRGKYLRPLYGELLRSAWGAETGRRIYRAARPRYHHVVRGALDTAMSAEASGPVAP